MPGHNVSLPSHRYVWVRPHYALRGVPVGTTPCLPAVWFGIVSAAGEALGCHVLLENGAVIHDLPLIALCSQPNPTARPTIEEAVGWDCFSDEAEVVEYDYLADRPVEVLSRDHKRTGIRGRAWFAVDWVGDGYSRDPAQRKHLHIIATAQGTLMAVPQDRLLWCDLSFTDIPAGVPPIIRQSATYRVEGWPSAEPPADSPSSPDVPESPDESDELA